MPITQQSTAICDVVDMTCAIVDGDVARVKALVAEGFPVETIHEAGSANMTLVDFANTFGNDAVRKYVATLHSANQAPYYLPYPAGLWRQATREQHAITTAGRTPSRARSF